LIAAAKEKDVEPGEFYYLAAGVMNDSLEDKTLEEVGRMPGRSAYGAETPSSEREIPELVELLDDDDTEAERTGKKGGSVDKADSDAYLPLQATHLDRCSESSLRASETRVVAFLHRSSRISHAISGFFILASDCASPLIASERSSLSCLPVGHNMLLSLSRAMQTFVPLQRLSGQNLS
jgi:hypothetical protein